LVFLFACVLLLCNLIVSSGGTFHPFVKCRQFIFLFHRSESWAGAGERARAGAGAGHRFCIPPPPKIKKIRRKCVKYALLPSPGESRRRACSHYRHVSGPIFLLVYFLRTVGGQIHSLISGTSFHLLPVFYPSDSFFQLPVIQH
jgi:hypothetical protein